MLSCLTRHETVYMEKCVWVTGSIYITYQCAAALCRFAAVIKPLSGLKGVTPSRVNHIFCHIYIKAEFHQNPFIFKTIPCSTAATVFEVTIFAADLSGTWFNFLAVCVTLKLSVHTAVIWKTSVCLSHSSGLVRFVTICLARLLEIKASYWCKGLRNVSEMLTFSIYSRNSQPFLHCSLV